MMPLDLFKDRTFSAATYVGYVANFAFYGTVFVFSLFFQSVQGKSALATGLAFVPMTCVIMLVNVAVGRLNGRYGLRPAMIGGLAIAAAGYLAMLSVSANSSYLTLAPSFMVAGIGIALTVPSVMTAGLAGTSAGNAGLGSGVINTARQIGGATGVALFGSLTGSAGGDAFVVGLHASVLLAGFALVTAAVVAFVCLPRQADPSTTTRKFIVLADGQR